MISHPRDISGLRVTVMGLGLNGGGLASARFFAVHGASVTVTDQRSAEVLAPSIEKLGGLPVKFVLGRHEEEDFRSADIVIKNPSVRADSPYLACARWVETDLSVFLSLCTNPVIAVTGSKGKSTTVSAIHHALRAVYPGARLGGNITVSPLSFFDAISPSDPIVLELSSWQLADLRGRHVLKPRVALITNILPDHQNMYSGMEAYVADKRLIYADQDRTDFTLVNADDPYASSFASETRGTVRYFADSVLPEGLDGAYFEGNAGCARTGTFIQPILPEALSVTGIHHRKNLLGAALALFSFGVDPSVTGRELQSFSGIEHRLERVAVKRGVTFFNDSAATIPQATAAAVRSMNGPVHLICGGTDKSLEFDVLREIAAIPESILLLEGTATAKMIPVLEEEGIPFKGPFDNLSSAVSEACMAAAPGDNVLLSPGCASFGMFLNEFDRGNRFRDIVRSLPD